MVAIGILIIRSSPLMQFICRNPHIYKTLCSAYYRKVLCDPLGITTYPVKKLSANARIAFLNETF